jgi:hypothetical protein
MRRSVQLAVVSSLVLAAACVPRAYETAHPAFAVFPSPGLTVHGTLAGLFDTQESDLRLIVHQVAIFRTDTHPWQEIPLEDLPPALEMASGSYAIAARRFCRTPGSEPGLVGGNEWFVFHAGRLAAFDSRMYRSECTVVPVIEPARGELIASETRVREWMAEKLPDPSEPSLVHYFRGIVYADAERLDVAEACLASGDAAPAGEERVMVFKTLLGAPRRAERAQIPDEIDAPAARALLVHELERQGRR